MAQNWNHWRSERRHWQANQRHWQACRPFAGGFFRPSRRWSLRRRLSLQDAIVLGFLVGLAVWINW